MPRRRCKSIPAYPPGFDPPLQALTIRITDQARRGRCDLRPVRSAPLRQSPLLKTSTPASPTAPAIRISEASLDRGGERRKAPLQRPPPRPIPPDHVSATQNPLLSATGRITQIEHTPRSTPAPPPLPVPPQSPTKAFPGSPSNPPPPRSVRASRRAPHPYLQPPPTPSTVPLKENPSRVPSSHGPTPQQSPLPTPPPVTALPPPHVRHPPNPAPLSGLPGDFSPCATSRCLSSVSLSTRTLALPRRQHR